MKKYATVMRELNELRKDMEMIPWIQVPDEELKAFSDAYKAIYELMISTKIPINIEDK